MPKISVIGLSCMESAGVRWLARRLSGLECGTVEMSFFDRYCEEALTIDKIDCYLITSDVFSSHTDYFIPRREKTIILSSLTRDVSWSGVEPDMSMGPRCIYRDTEQEEMLEILKSVLTSKDTSLPDSDRLSGREIDVLRLLAVGKTNKEIADRLSISVNTVITHRKNISSKLGIKTISGLSLYALMNGLI